MLALNVSIAMPKDILPLIVRSELKLSTLPLVSFVRLWSLLKVSMIRTLMIANPRPLFFIPAVGVVVITLPFVVVYSSESSSFRQERMVQDVQDLSLLVS